MPKKSPAFRLKQRAAEPMRRSASSAMQWSGIWGSSSKCGSWRAVDSSKTQNKQVMRPRCMMNSHLLSLLWTSWTGCLKDTLHVYSFRKIGPVLVISRTTAEPRPKTFLIFAPGQGGTFINWASWRQETRNLVVSHKIGQTITLCDVNRILGDALDKFSKRSWTAQAVLHDMPNPADIFGSIVWNPLQPRLVKGFVEATAISRPWCICVDENQ